MASEFLEVAAQVLRTHGRPMSAQEIVGVGLKEKRFSDRLAGKTPHQTLKSKLSVDIRRRGEQSLFVRVAPGRFFLRDLTEPGAVFKSARLMPPAKSELVLGFPTSRLEAIGRFQGITRSWKRTWEQLTQPGLEVVERHEAEQREDFKQIITYVIVTKGDELLGFRRGNFNRVEDSLRGAQCVGFGGHALATDITLLSDDFDVAYGCAARELAEELALPADDLQRLAARQGLSIVGLLNDDSSAAGRRHFAVVMRFEAQAVRTDENWIEKGPQRGEQSIAQLRWLKPPDLQLRRFEYWSQLTLRTFFPDVAREQPSYAIRRRAAFQPPHILCLLGPVGSGKTDAASILRERFGYQELNSGRILAKILGLAPVPKTRRDVFQAASWRFISSQQGPAILARALLDEAQSIKSARILIDGIRQPATLAALRGQAVRARLASIFVQTPPDTAFELYRKREGSDLDINDFLAARDAPVESEVEELIGQADAVLYNWIGHTKYRRAVSALMNDLGLPRI